MSCLLPFGVKTWFSATQLLLCIAAFRCVKPGLRRHTGNRSIAAALRVPRFIDIRLTRCAQYDVCLPSGRESFCAFVLLCRKARNPCSKTQTVFSYRLKNPVQQPSDSHKTTTLGMELPGFTFEENNRSPVELKPTFIKHDMEPPKFWIQSERSNTTNLGTNCTQKVPQIAALEY